MRKQSLTVPGGAARMHLVVDGARGEFRDLKVW